jgi:hypothetical protein
MVLKFLKYINKYLLFGLLSLTKNHINRILCFFFLKNYDFVYKSYYKKNKLDNNQLNILFDKYQCDKGFQNLRGRVLHNNYMPHTYGDFYEKLFNNNKDSIKKIFEFGIGTNNSNIPSNMGKKFIPGASLRVWRDYFINAEIYGADIDKKILFSENRIKTFYVDQLKPETFDGMWEQVNENEFDIIIDDGLHTLEAGINTFEKSFKKINKDGIYIIEDVDLCILKNLSNFFINTNINYEIISFSSNVMKLLKDSNLFIIKKNNNL